MPGSPLSLDGCRGANTVTAGELRSMQETIAVSCAESRNLMLFSRGTGGQWQATSVPFTGGWGAVTIARLTKNDSGALIAANNNATITIYFPQ